MINRIASRGAQIIPRINKIQFDFMRSFSSGMVLSEEHLKNLRNIVGDSRVLTEDIKGYTTCWTGQYGGNGSAVVLPKDTLEISSIHKYCNTNNLKVVPQAGNTSLVGGASAYNGEIIINVSRLNEIYNFDSNTGMITAGAGVILQNLQTLAQDAGFEFPVSLGSKGSCQIGGNVATQAGGTLYFKHGSIRNHIRGLEVVLATGEILDLQSTISKDNVGPDLKELFIGSEGTLGIITKVNISCPRADTNQEVLFMKITGYENVFKIVNLTKSHFNHDLTALEFLDYYSYGGIEKFFSNQISLPYKASECEEQNYFVLVQVRAGNKEVFESLLESYYEKSSGIVDDMLMAENDTQKEHFWKIRENVGVAGKYSGYVYKYDCSIPCEKSGELLRWVRSLYGDKMKALFGFGHIGDDNTHLNIIANTDKYSPDEIRAEFEPQVFKYVIENGGSISAEHGIGSFKTKYRHLIYPEPVWRTMLAMKNTMDPNRILNPEIIFKDA